MAAASFEKNIPILDRLRVSLAHQEYDRGGVGRSIKRQALLPVRRNQTLGRDRVDVIGQRERDHICLQAVDNGARLRARAAMRLLDLDALSALLLISRDEGLVEFGVEFARRI